MANDLNNTLNSNDNYTPISKQTAIQITNAKKAAEIKSKLFKQLNIEQRKAELKNNKLSVNDRRQLELALQRDIEYAERQSVKAAIAYRKNIMTKGTTEQKLNIIKADKEAAKFKWNDLKSQQAEELAGIRQGSKEYTNAKKRHATQDRKLIREEAELRKQQRELEDSERNKQSKKLINDVKNLKSDGVKGAIDVVQDVLHYDVDSLLKDSQAQMNAKIEEISELESEYEALKESGASDIELTRKQDEIDAAKKDKDLAAVQNEMAKLLVSIKDTYKQAFNQAESMLSDYKGHIDARLQGSQADYNSVMDKISTNLSMSPFVKTTEVINKMRDAVDQGIAYNVEQRAFLATISDKIANTFDAFDSNLTRLIRLQQADTTAARMGMEAALTKFLNSTFSDTQYLSDSGAHDSVSAVLLDATAIMDRNASAEFEYIVQKWLGSLSSVGMSQETLTTIAEGLNYIATGNVTNLASNTQLQTLMAMSASRAGLEYSTLLTEGLNASNTNKLLEAMVAYLKDIAQDSSNNVVRSAYGNVFNLSMSDMKAITNLTSGDIGNIAANTLSYGNMMSEMNTQMSQLYKRTSIASMMSTLYENAIFGVASDMANNPLTYSMTKMLDFMEGSNLDMAIPFVSAAGFGVDLNTSVQDIMRLGVGLTQAMSLMGNILGGLGSKGGLNLDAWGATEYTSRGSGLVFTTSTALGDTSGATYVGTQSSKDIKNAALTSATNEATETEKITNKNAKTEHTFDEFYGATVGDSAKSYIKTLDSQLLVLSNSTTEYLSVQDSRMNFESGNLKITDVNRFDLSKDIFKVSVQNSVVPITPLGGVMSVNINNTQSLQTATQEVKGTIKLDKASIDAIVNGIIKSSSNSHKGKDAKSITDLFYLFATPEDDHAIVGVINASGHPRLQVDTEQAGSSASYSTQNYAPSANIIY